MDSAAAPLVTTTAGEVRGIDRGGSAAFLGIPFAQPPVGALRFRAPVPPEPWEGVRDATVYGATPQRRPFGAVTTIPEPSVPGEATLNVNVFTPAPGDRGACLPVLVWIHGGGFLAGSPASPWYDGAAFNRDGVVTVTISYRLGFDGFGWIDGMPANRGILDQIAALEWVRDNIRAFGGDPARVTIAGQSAGGGSVMYLLAAPGARGLFHGAIAQSPSWTHRTSADGAAVSRALARELGIDGIGADGFLALDEEAILDASSRVDAGAALGLEPAHGIDLLGAGRDAMPLAFVPIIDGEVLAPVADVVATPPVPLLIGTTANEFGFPAEPGDLDGVMAALGAAGARDDALAAFRAELDGLGAAFLQGQLLSEAMFRMPVARFATQAAATAWGATTWLYDFRHHSPVSRTAGHCHDLPFTWDGLAQEGVTAVLGEEPPQPLADRMHGDWVRFVREGCADWAPVDDAPSGAFVYDMPDSAYGARAYGLESDLAARL
ncbi:carboxylesterase/lipase family protein [Microbacterium gilvum]|uniref:Carboxylic ester hydrolase n=1 Tax=Microbacterium gilvum TaxID=1336204 RepID=A0ABP9A171_9MICO